MCGGKGIVVLNWSDAPHDYAVCLCETGERYRMDRNHGRRVTPQWAIWCAREGIAPSRMYLLEEALTAEELAEAGFGNLDRQTPRSREAALLEAGKRSSRR
jgi:hypothetical protein